MAISTVRLGAIGSGRLHLRRYDQPLDRRRLSRAARLLVRLPALVPVVPFGYTPPAILH